MSVFIKEFEEYSIDKEMRTEYFYQIIYKFPNNKAVSVLRIFGNPIYSVKKLTRNQYGDLVFDTTSNIIKTEEELIRYLRSVKRE